MKTAIGAFLAATVAAIAMAENCNLGAIQSSLYPNATQGLADCYNATGVDIFAISEFPTEKQAESVFQDRDCVDYYNQINQVANSQIQCTINVGGTDIVFADLITALLTGHTGNESDSGSGSAVEFPESDSGSGDASASDASDAGDDSASGNSTASASSSNAAACISNLLSLVSLGAAALIAAALY